MHHDIEIFLLLLVSLSVITVMARCINLSYPIACVIGGIVLALIPDFPILQIKPDLILLIFLPILLTEAAYLTSLRDFRENFTPISRLAIGLVAFTAFLVAAAFKFIIPDASWGLGLALGAIVSAPDAVAAIAVLKNLPMPKRILTVLEGESLINDAVALVIYKFAVGAVITGTFSATEASIHFVWVVICGVSVGWVLGMIYMRLFQFIKEQSVEILSTFLLPYVVYIVTEQLQGSGVLAVVTSGVVTGWLSPQKFSSKFRMQSEAVWNMMVFIMNGFVFLFIGLYFPSLVQKLSGSDGWLLVKSTLLITAVVIIARFIWVFAITYGQRLFFNAKRKKKEPLPPWQNVFIVSWTSMRGVMSLATALALPLLIQNGNDFPHRDLIIFIALNVIVITLVLQGLTLPWLIDKLALRYDARQYEETWLARKESADRAMEKLQEIAKRGNLEGDGLKRVKSHYSDRLISLGDGPNTPLNSMEPPKEELHPIIKAENDIWQEVLDIERQSIIKLRKDFKIGDEVMHDLLREIDLLDTRFKN